MHDPVRNGSPPVGFSLLLSAATARQALTQDAQELVTSYIRRQQNSDGGFRGRDPNGKSDTYYSFFALAGLLALGEDHRSFDDATAWLEGMSANTPELDPIHRICLAQGQALVRRKRMLRWMLQHGARSRVAQWMYTTISGRMKGSWGSPFSSTERASLLQILPPDAQTTSDGSDTFPELYHLFLRIQLYESLGIKLDMIPVLDILKACSCPDGGYSSAPGRSLGITSATAAALILQVRSGHPPSATTIQWLLDRRDEEGGFAGSPTAPMADLLSTSVALFALDYSDHPLDKTACALTESYVSAHWNEDGGFCGTVLDPDSDVEYTFYGILALGCLHHMQSSPLQS